MIIILQWLIPDIEYITGDKTMAKYAISWLANNRNQQSTHKCNWSMENMSELYDTDELPESKFPITFDLTVQYQWK